MIPPQTGQILLGVLVALVYAGATLGIGALFLGLSVGRRGCAAARAQVGLSGLGWLGFVAGQGILGLVWLVLSFNGSFHPYFVGIACVLGWSLVGAIAFAFRRQVVSAFRRSPGSWYLESCSWYSWYSWLAIGFAVVILLRGVIALLPPTVGDAVQKYLVTAKMIAFTHTLDFQPFAPPIYGLFPLQIELHWSALFSISNETAVTTWDFLCALSLLAGIGVITRFLTSSRRACLFAVLAILSTPAFVSLMGGGKCDNASAQYALAIFLWLLLWSALGRRAALLAGLCTGWALASRYTNFILIPATIVFAVMMIVRARRDVESAAAAKRLRGSWTADALVGTVATCFGAAPMLIKNWLLVGCPLAPQIGCQETFWASEWGRVIVGQQNLSVLDFALYPFVWTFGDRFNMLGNLGPLFLGFFPFFLICRRFVTVQSTMIVGVAGLVSLASWVLVQPLILFTRYLLPAVALIAIPLGAAAAAAEGALRDSRFASRLAKTALFVLLFYCLIACRNALPGIRYLLAVESRAVWYQQNSSVFGYDAATWLNDHVRPGQRVALRGGNLTNANPYFVNGESLLNSESAEELQWLWEHGPGGSWSADWWRFYVEKGFTYVVIPKSVTAEALSTWPPDMECTRVDVRFEGRGLSVLRIVD